MKKILKKTGIFLLQLCFTIGAIGFVAYFLCHGLSYAGVRMVSAKIRFPLGERRAFTVGKEGHIIYYSDLSRLEVFDPQGRFLKGWFVYTPSLSAQIRTDPNNHIHIASADDKHLVFDIDGNILEESEEAGVYDRFFELNQNREHRDNEGNTYTLWGNVLRAGVIKLTAGGEEFIDITEPFYLWPFRGLRAALLFLFFSLIPAAIIEGLRKRKRKRQNPEAAEPAAVH